MSTFTAFERAKLSRFITVYGNSFTFKRNALNAYKEPTDEVETTITINGVYHEASGDYVSQSTKDGTQYIKQPQPMILCLQSKEADKIRPDDEVEIQQNKYKVIRMNMVGKLGYAWDISLELIDDGSNLGLQSSDE